ncbi:type II toxin-antitoxin system HipA family toxin [Undibacterium sp. RuRC25W]|uniref:type II toxin-antitoxin system HipA family toxin n=1 Tax=Undibacterium sp. RuRC25W TaxID=3413047 RepID=UPI003BF0EB1D
MLNTSKPLFIYLQRPDNGEWITVGRYLAGPVASSGRFKYAPSYVDAGHTWAIDPVNLPFRPEDERPATRYNGLHDVLRDACPDSWGQALLRREHNLPEDTPLARYLILANNADRWGALAVGTKSTPSVAQLSYPKLFQLPLLVQELAAMSAQRPAVDVRLRRRLVQTASVGGARPKATLRDNEGKYWLVKPRIPSDIADIPCLEHVGQQWGAASGLDFAATVLHPAAEGTSAVRVLRYDRIGDRRLMCVSAASLLQAEYPDKITQTDLWSYPRLAEELRIIGAPVEDRRELFGRMVFNAVCGNDDDHVRNHAVVYQHEQRRWRLAPAFDVVPNPVETPRTLTLQLSTGRFDISRSTVLADAHRFGFDSSDEASRYLDTLLKRISKGFNQVAHWLEPEWQEMLRTRMRENIALLET